MNRSHYDSDEEIFRQTGRTPETLIREDGEEAFRREESRVLKELCSRSGCVISCGGGVVTRQENFPVIRQNSRVVWVKRPLERLSTAGRPLSMGPGALEKLYAERRDAYNTVADFAVDNTGAPEEMATEILSMLKKGARGYER